MPVSIPEDTRTERPSYARRVVLALTLVAMAFVAAWFAQTTIPRQVVLAAGPAGDRGFALAQRYRESLAREGIDVVVLATAGPEDNARLVTDPDSGVDVAFVPGGVVPPAARSRVEMLASLHYVPLWIFYRDAETLTRLNELRYKRVAVGAPGDGVQRFLEPLLAANNLTGFNTRLQPLGGIEALRALQAGQVDAVFLLGEVETPAVFQALRDPAVKLMNVARAEAYERRFGHLTHLDLPPGTIDFGLGIPERDTRLIGTEAMLVARESLSPAIVHLLLDAARDIHGGQGYFEPRRAFPVAHPVDLPVSDTAKSHLDFGASLLHRHLPFFVATYVERLLILLMPVLFLLLPLISWLPQALRWRARSRIVRGYGELKLLELEVDRRQGELPIARWLADLDRIDRKVASVRLPASMASEGYTLREHVALVRRAIVARSEGADGKLESTSVP